MMKTDHIKLKTLQKLKPLKLTSKSFYAASQPFKPYFIGPQLAQIYKFPLGDGTGQKLSFISLGGGYVLSDVKYYLDALGIDSTNISVKDVLIDNATNNPGTDEDADIENIMDLEIIISVCPKADIFVYIAPNSEQGFYNAIYQAGIVDRVDVISISWGNNENQFSDQGLNEFNLLLEQIATIGTTTVFCASGDWGSSSGQDGLNVIFPASSPFVTGCGGTSLIVNENNEITSETVWNRNPETSSTGGGLSSKFATPSYQLENVHNIDLQGKRGVPDVSSVSDAYTGIVVYSASQGGFFVVGGTSISSPLWAGLAGRINQNLKAQGLANVGFMNPVIYTATTIAFNDITVGNNGFYQSVEFYDLCTGNGSPNGIKLSNLYSSTLASQFEYTIVNNNIVSFQDKSLGQPVTWSWDFGDGSKSTEKNPTHTYANIAKNYQVSLTVTNADRTQTTVISKTLEITQEVSKPPSALIISLVVVSLFLLLFVVVFLAYKFHSLNFIW